MRCCLWLVTAGLVVSGSTVALLRSAVPPPVVAAGIPAQDGPFVPGTQQLPLAQVVLFSSGVGYFQREGEVEGNAHVDLTFPLGDVNDLLKSLVLQDLGGGKIGTVTYDGQEPVEATLRSFALDLTGNPTLAQLLTQARGEKVEITLSQAAAGTGLPGTMSGQILGVEQDAAVHPTSGAAQSVYHFNLHCAEGLRSVKLADVQRIRFLNANLDGELRKAVTVLAASHDAQKKSVRLGFKGEGKRKVRVGYVVENPIWKTSYRLTLDGAKPGLQGWAAVENTTDEDWRDVRVVLVAGRPISFQMDLYPPIFVPRPTVEPERFASLRPPSYQGPLVTANNSVGVGNPGAGGGNLGFGGMGQLGGQLGLQGNRMPVNGPMNGTPNDQATQEPLQRQRLTYEQLQQRRAQNNLPAEPTAGEPKPDGRIATIRQQAREVGSRLAALDPHQSIASAAAAEELGDSFRYIIDDTVSLPRQKAALLPVLDAAVEAARVSIFNAQVHPKFPLLGVRFKNSTGQPLTQGAVTVYEGGSYAGDARMPDLQPDEERLLSYAIDLGSEVQQKDTFSPAPTIIVRPLENQAQVRFTMRSTRTYTARNRSKQDRTLVIEHPVRDEWKLAEGQKPRERSRDVYRFETALPAGKPVTLAVAEEQSRSLQLAPSGTVKAANGVIATVFPTGLGIEVRQAARARSSELQGVRLVKGELVATARERQTRTVTLLNQSDEKRTFVLEHQPAADWKLQGDHTPVKGTRDLYRFELPAEKGQAVSHDLTEERTAIETTPLAKVDTKLLERYASHAAVKAEVRAALTGVLEQQAKLAEVRRQISDIEGQLKAIAEEQGRLRANLEKVPPSSAAYKRYLEKFDTQETQIESLQEQLKKQKTAEQSQRTALETAIGGLTVE